MPHFFRTPNGKRDKNRKREQHQSSILSHGAAHFLWFPQKSAPTKARKTRQNKRQIAVWYRLGSTYVPRNAILGRSYGAWIEEWPGTDGNDGTRTATNIQTDTRKPPGLPKIATTKKQAEWCTYVVRRLLTLPRHPEGPVVFLAPTQLRPHAVAPLVGILGPVAGPFALSPDVTSHCIITEYSKRRNQAKGTDNSVRESERDNETEPHTRDR